MKIRLLTIILLVTVLSGVLAGCDRTTEITEVPATIVTLWTISDGPVSKETEREIELALNKLVFYRAEGVIIDLEFFEEDEYMDKLEERFIAREQYEKDKKASAGTKKPASESSAASEESSRVLTGDVIIEEYLDKGLDIPVDESIPALDIFYLPSYDDYYTYAGMGRMIQIDDDITSGDAVIVTSYLHSDFFAAAKLNKKTYGIASNRVIGEYEYMVFDKEILDACGYDYTTMKSLEDLQKYLETVQEKFPDVVPLANAYELSDYNFMFENGFPVSVDALGNVIESYKSTPGADGVTETNTLLNYYSLITRYNLMGFFENSSGSSEGRSAVQFVTGDAQTLLDIEQESGEIEYNVYKKPESTNDNTIEGIFCVSKYCVATKKTSAMKLLSTIYTDPEIQNILAYGIEGTHYEIINASDGQIRRISDEYLMSTDRTGNGFLTYTLEGENPDKWLNAKKHNESLSRSDMIGFDFIRSSFTYTDDETGLEKFLFEPDYIALISKAIDKHYESFIRGTSDNIEGTYDEMYQQARDDAYEAFKADLLSARRVLMLAEYKNALKEAYMQTAEAQVLYAETVEYVNKQYIERMRKDAMNAIDMNALREQYPDYDDKQLQEVIDAMLTDEYLFELAVEKYTLETIEGSYDATMSTSIEKAINEDYKAYESEGIEKALAALAASSEFVAELDSKFASQSTELINASIVNLLTDSVLEKADLLMADIEIILEEAVNNFVKEAVELTDISEDTIKAQIGLTHKKGADSPTEEPEEGEEPAESSEEVEESSAPSDGEDDFSDYVRYDTYFEFLYNKLAAQYLVVYPKANS